MSESYRPQTSIMVYYRNSFFGRDAGENFQATSGLTGWVAENFDHLGLGNPPYGEDRRVHEGNRAVGKTTRSNFWRGGSLVGCKGMF